jgi:hypothetical protein
MIIDVKFTTMKKQLISIVIALISFAHIYSQEYSVDIPNTSSIYAAQKQSNWCWAACNQMLLSAQDIDESQENQSIKVFGTVINREAGDNYELAKVGLSGIYQDSSGNTVKIVPYVSYLYKKNTNDPIVIINKLNDGIPLVMATTTHGRVCVGVDYIKNGSYYQITKLRLLDPNSDSSEIIEYTMQQFIIEGLIGFMTYKVQ